MRFFCVPSFCHVTTIFLQTLAILRFYVGRGEGSSLKSPLLVGCMLNLIVDSYSSSTQATKNEYRLKTTCNTFRSVKTNPTFSGMRRFKFIPPHTQKTYVQFDWWELYSNPKINASTTCSFSHYFTSKNTKTTTFLRGCYMIFRSLNRLEVSEELRQRVAQEEEVRAEMLWR